MKNNWSEPFIYEISSSRKYWCNPMIAELSIKATASNDANASSKTN